MRISMPGGVFSAIRSVKNCFHGNFIYRLNLKAIAHNKYDIGHKWHYSCLSGNLDGPIYDDKMPLRRDLILTKTHIYLKIHVN